MAGNFLKLAGVLLLLLVSVLAACMTWDAELLSPLGGVSIMIMSLLGAVLMWQDIVEAWRGVEAKNGRRSNTDR